MWALGPDVTGALFVGLWVLAGVLVWIILACLVVAFFVGANRNRHLNKED